VRARATRRDGVRGRAYAEPDQLFGVELRRDVALVEAEQLAVKRAGSLRRPGGIAIETCCNSSLMDACNQMLHLTRLPVQTGDSQTASCESVVPQGVVRDERAGPRVLHIDDDIGGAFRRHGEPDPDDDRIAVSASHFDDCSDGWPHGSVDPGDRLVVLEFVDQRADFRLRLWHAMSMPGLGLDKPWHCGLRPSSARVRGGAILIKGRAERRAPFGTAGRFLV
jgi:hypothetical protein